MKLETIAAHLTRPRMGRRLAVLTVSLMVIGTSVALFKTAGFGTDPYSTFTLSISARTGVSFGTCQLVCNLLMFLPVIRFDLSRIGVGTVANMVGIGYVADFWMWIIGQHTPPEGFSMGARILMLLVSMAAFLAAAAFYMVVDLGVAPYDAIPQLIAAHTSRLSARAVRMLWDILILSIGFLLGSTVGLTTLIAGFCLGPAITFVSDHVKHWFA